MRLYRFEYSCYARKVQMALDLCGAAYEIVDVPYGDRSVLVGATGGYVQVPVLVDGARTIVDSAVICRYLVAERGGAGLVPAPWDGPIWAFHDWCDGPLEDVMFRLASPPIADRFTSPAGGAMYVFVKERRYGPGCVETWRRERDALAERARQLLLPVGRTLGRQPYLFGPAPTLADAGLFGQCIMVELAAPGLVARLEPALPVWMKRVESERRG